MFRKTQHIHLVGIGGSGMSGIAEVLLTLGYKVTGSDLKLSDTTPTTGGTRRATFSSAIRNRMSERRKSWSSLPLCRRSNPEVVAARRRQIPVIPRAEMLAELMRLKFGVAIAGAHGKTTTTSMVANVLAQGGLDPTMVIGGKVNALGSHARLGRGDLLVAEADESDGSFLRLSPTIVAVTNLDREHLDHYGTMERIDESFLEFINNVPFYGLAVLCADDDRLQGAVAAHREALSDLWAPGDAEGVVPDFLRDRRQLKQWGAEFRAHFRGSQFGTVSSGRPRRFIMCPTRLSAIAIGVELDVPVDLIRKGLAAFTGVERRFHLRGESQWHHGRRRLWASSDRDQCHPGRSQARMGDRRLVVLFQPHRYTQNARLLEDFAQAFDQADVVFLTDIYAAGEQPIHRRVRSQVG